MGRWVPSLIDLRDIGLTKWFDAFDMNNETEPRIWTPECLARGVG